MKQIFEEVKVDKKTKEDANACFSRVYAELTGGRIKL